MVDEVVAAGLLGDGRRRLRDLDVLQVQEPQLHLHAQQRVQVAFRQLAGHVLPQESVKPVNPDTVLRGKTNKKKDNSQFQAVLNLSIRATIRDTPLQLQNRKHGRELTYGEKKTQR